MQVICKVFDHKWDTWFYMLGWSRHCWRCGAIQDGGNGKRVNYKGLRIV